MIKTFLLALKTCLATLCLLFATSSLAESFVFTAIPDEDETRLKERFGKVAEYLSASLGVEVSYVPVKSYAAAVAAFRNNQVQLAWFGGLTGVQARRLVPDSKAIAQGDEDQYFKSYFIAHNSTGLKPSERLPEQVDGMSFTFGSKSSTSGRLMPEFYLREHFKHTPEKTFARVGFSGNHSRTLALVQSGAYQLGALNYKVWENEVRDGKVDLNKVSIIWETPHYPDYQWTLRGDVEKTWGEGFSQRVSNALINMKDPDLLAAFPRSAFVPATNSDYQAILDTARGIGIID